MRKYVAAHSSVQNLHFTSDEVAKALEDYATKQGYKLLEHDTFNLKFLANNECAAILTITEK